MCKVVPLLHISCMRVGQDAQNLPQQQPRLFNNMKQKGSCIHYCKWNRKVLVYIIVYHIIVYHIIVYHIIVYHIIVYHIIVYHIIVYQDRTPRVFSIPTWTAAKPHTARQAQLSRAPTSLTRYILPLRQAQRPRVCLPTAVLPANLQSHPHGPKKQNLNPNPWTLGRTWGV